jgi:tetratricopeptide (TPR) repeat protein
MKWTVAIVAVVVGVAGLCRADDARRDFDNRSRCFAPDGAVSPEQRRESCTAVIESPGQTRQALVVAYDNRGIHYSRKGEYDRAIPDFDEAIRLDPKFAQAYNNRGIAYNNKGSYDHAIADFDEAIRLNPKFTLAYYNRGLSYGRKGELNRAIADLDEAIRLNPKYSAAYNARAFVYASMGDYARAIADYDQALTFDPSLAVARQNRQLAQSAMATQTAPTAASAERRVALVIGNSQYRSEAFLPNPRRDAKAVADALRQVGFQSVELKMNLDRDAMLKALRAFRDQADKADWALIYFAGHGIEINRVNYLIPIDAKLLDDRDVQTETVSYEELLPAAGGAKMLRLIVLDACRVNPFKDTMRRTMASRGANDRGLAAPPEAEPGTMIVYSAKDGEVAADDVDGVNSPFARAFVAELKVPGREVRRLFDNVRDDVLDATNNRQQPFTYGSLSGRRDFYFVAKK